MRVLVAVTLAAVLGSVDALAAACPGGRFAVAGTRLLGAGPGTDAVVLDAGSVAIASGCDPAAAHAHGREGRRLTARWRHCFGVEGRVRLRATLDAACTTMTGVLVTPRRRPHRRRFTATADGFELVQPIPVDWRWVDEHVIAFFDGHPTYEAVEAFVENRGGTEPFVRAILTRHDGTQADYVNDLGAVDAPRSFQTGREIHYEPVQFTRTGSGTSLAVMLRFTTVDDESVVLDFFAATDTLAAFGGPTDPVGHAPDVLPILFRAASAVASGQTSVSIGGQALAIPPFAPLGVDAFYTAGLGIGIVPSGTADLVRVEAPALAAPGERWVYDWPGGRSTFTIASRTGDHLVIDEAGEHVARIEGRLVRGRVEILQIAVASASATPSTLSFVFDPGLPDVASASAAAAAGRFTIAVDGHADLVTGAVVPGDGAVALVPDAPAWATTGAVRLRVTAAGAHRLLTSTVGP
jgi:hypothetical protein